MATIASRSHPAVHLTSPAQVLVHAVTDIVPGQGACTWCIRVQDLPLSKNKMDSFVNDSTTKSVFVAFEMTHISQISCPNLTSLRLRNVLIEPRQLMAVLQRHKDTLRCLTLCNIFVLCGKDGIVSWLLHLSLWLKENTQLNALYLGKDFRDEHGTIVHCCENDHMKYGLREQLIYYILDRKNAGQWPFESISPFIQDLIEQKISSVGASLVRRRADDTAERLARPKQDRTFWIQVCDPRLQNILFLPPICCHGPPIHPASYSGVVSSTSTATKPSRVAEPDKKMYEVIADKSLVPVWAVGPLRTGNPRGPEIVSIIVEPVDQTETFDVEEPLGLDMISADDFPDLKSLIICSLVAEEDEIMKMIMRHGDTLTNLKISSLCIGRSSGVLRFLFDLIIQVVNFPALVDFELEGFMADNCGTFISFGPSDPFKSNIMSKLEDIIGIRNPRLPWPWPSSQPFLEHFGEKLYVADGARLISTDGDVAPHLYPEQDDSFWIEEGYVEWARTWWQESD